MSESRILISYRASSSTVTKIGRAAGDLDDAMRNRDMIAVSH
jgi:hypothetical protein